MGREQSGTDGDDPQVDLVTRSDTILQYGRGGTTRSTRRARLRNDWLEQDGRVGDDHQTVWRALEPVQFISLAGKETTLYWLRVVVITTGFSRAVDLAMTISHAARGLG